MTTSLALRVHVVVGLVLAGFAGCAGQERGGSGPGGGGKGDDPSSCAYALPATLDLGGEPSSVTAVDLDRDGCNDLVTLAAYPAMPAVAGPVVFVVAWGDLDAPFEERTELLLPGSAPLTPADQASTRDSSTHVLQVIDLDDDGELDVVTAGGIVIGQGSRTFAWRPLDDGEDQLLLPVAVADLRGDGVISIVRGTRRGAVQACSAAGACAPLAGETECSPDIGCPIEDLELGDFDRDGRPDVLAGGPPFVEPYTQRSRLWLSSQDHANPIETQVDFADLEAGDVDGDGFPDLVAQIQEFISDFPSHTEVWLSDPSEPTFFRRVQELRNFDNHTDNAALADVNRDGCLDYLAIGVDTGVISIRLGRPRPAGGCDGTLGEGAPGDPSTGWRMLPAPAAIGIQVIDVNGDRTPEWVLRDATELRLHFMPAPAAIP